MRAGKYKISAETYVASAPSKETLESDKVFVRWQSGEALLGAVEPAQLAPGSIMKTINQIDELMVAAE